MKNIVSIVFILVFTSTYSQAIIDTSEIVSIRYEYKLNKKNKDSVLNQILTQYKSGIYKEVFTDFEKDPTKFYFTTIFESKTPHISRDLKSSIKLHYWQTTSGWQRYYYDAFGNLDSIFSRYEKDSLRAWNTTATNVYRSKGKLKYRINTNGDMEVYRYTLFGSLKRIEVYKDSVQFEIRNYKDGMLVNQIFPTRKEYRKKLSYKYDEKGRMIKRDDNDYEYVVYQYGDFGLSRIEKRYKKNNKVSEYSLFFYDKEGRLQNKKVFEPSDRLREEFSYQYHSHR